MIKLKNKKILVVAIFLLAVVSISIGYAFFTRTLNINGNASIAKNTWDIHFNDINERCYSISAETPAYIVDNEKTQIDFKVNLTKPGQIYSFDADIVNAGSIDAMIESATLSGIPEEIKDTIIWDVTYLNGDKLQPCDELLHESTRKIRVVVQYKDLDDEEELIGGQELNLSLVVKYVQSDSSVCTLKPAGADPVDDPVCAERMLTINPNGGMYDGKTDNSIVAMKPFSTYEVLVPEREEFEFDGWTVSETGVYENNIVTMGENNITMTANWKAVVHTHNLTINPNGGTYDGKTENTVYEMIAEETREILAPSRDGYRFLGWNITPESVELNSENVIVMGDEDITLVADWEEIPKNTLTIDPNEGIYNGETSATIVFMNTDETYTMLEATYEGFEFDYWEVSIDGVYNEENGIVTMGTQDITMTAHWKDINVPVDSVARIKRVYYPTIQEAFDDAVEDDVIHMLKSTTESPTNNTDASITLDLERFTVTGTMTNNGDLTLLNGSLVSDDSVGFVNNGILTMGKNDETVVIDNTIDITGNNKALEQKGTFKFYDGYLEATLGLDGKANDLPENRVVYIDRNVEKDCQKVYPSLGIDRAIAKTTVDDIDYRFVNMQDAFDNAMNNNVTVYSISSANIGYDLHIDEGKTVTYDTTDEFKFSSYVSLGGNIINNGNFNVINSLSFTGKITNNTGSSLSLKNSYWSYTGYSESNPIGMDSILGMIDNHSDSVSLDNSRLFGSFYNDNDDLNIICVNESQLSYIVNDGKVTINDCRTGSIENKTGGIVISNGADIYGTVPDSYESSAGISYTIHNGGTFEMNGGNIKFGHTTGGGYVIPSYGIYGGTVVINDGEIYGYGNKSLGIGNAAVTFNGGTIISYAGYGAYGIDGGTLEMNGGTINTRDGGIAINGVTGVINNGVVSANSVGIKTNRSLVINDLLMGAGGTCISGTITVNGGKYTCGVYGVYGEAVVNDGTFNSKLTGAFGSVKINGGTIISSEDDGATGNVIVNGSEGKIPYIEGAINGITADYDTKVTNAKVVGKTGYGIYIPNNATLSLGLNDGNISSLIPEVIGDTYGVYVEDEGIFKFYDGIIKGQVDDYAGNISDMPVASNILEESEVIDEKDFVTGSIVAHENFARVGTEEFNSLDDAFAAIDDIGTVVITRDSVLGFASTVPSGKNITIDFNGNKLKLTNSIINNGTLTLTDSTGSDSLDIEGGINKNDSIIVNRGTLNISDGLYDVSSSFITNTSTVNLNGGTINITSDRIGIVNDGTFNINNGELNALCDIDNCTTYMISSSDKKSGTVNMTAGVINADYAIIGVNVFEMSGGVINSGIKGVDTNFAHIVDGEFNSGENALKTQYLVLDNANINSESGIALIVDYKTPLSHNDSSIYGNGNVINNIKINAADQCLYVGASKSFVINDGTITCGGNAITGLDASIKGGRIISLNSSALSGNSFSIGVYSDEELASINESDYPYIEGKINGVYDTSIVAVDKATVVGKTGSAIESKSITLGVNDSNMNQDYPIIIGATNGIKSSSSNVNFYDGVIKGIEKAYDALIYGLADGFDVVDYTEEVDGVTYKAAKLSVLDEFIKVGDNTYNNFEDALNAISDTGTMKLIAGGVLSSNLYIPSEKNVTLDLNGNNLRMTAYVHNDGTFILKDSVGGGIITSLAYNVFANRNNMTIESGIIKAKSMTMIDNEDSYGVLEIKGGTFELANDNGQNIIISSYSSYEPVKITGGTFRIRSYIDEDTWSNSYINAINVDNVSEISNVIIEIETNTNSSNVSGISLNSSYGSDTDSPILIDNVTINEMNTGEYDHGNGIVIKNHNVEINNSTINANYCVKGIIESDDEKIVINNTDMVCGDNGITISNSGSYESEVLVIDGGSVLSKGQAVDLDYGTLTVKSGTITSSEEAAISVENESADSNMIIGDSNDSLNESSPVITGATYAIDTTNFLGKVYFYDGILKGQTGLTVKGVYDVYPNSYIYRDIEIMDDNEYQRGQLRALVDVYENVATGAKYNNLQNAIDEASARDRIKLIDDSQIYYDVTLDSTDDVIVDLNGHKLEIYRTIDNSGQLSIVDLSNEKNGIIHGEIDVTMIDNRGTLTISGLDIEKDSVTKYTIENETGGTLNITGVNINATQNGIKNNSNAVLNIENSTVSGASYQIYDSGESHILNSTFNGESQYGIYYSNVSGESSITGSIINSVDSAIYNNSGSNRITITDTTISSGTLYNGGTMDVSNSVISGNVRNFGNLVIDGNDIINNTTKTIYIHNNGSLTLTDNTIIDYNGIYSAGGTIISSGNVIRNVNVRAQHIHVVR